MFLSLNTIVSLFFLWENVMVVFKRIDFFLLLYVQPVNFPGDYKISVSQRYMLLLQKIGNLEYPVSDLSY